MNEPANRLHFRTNVQLKSILGKDLILNNNIAVLELVKNSYDAGSPRGIVEFSNLKENDDNENMDDYSERSSKLFIKDFGVGMDDTDIKEKWLNIAYSEKKSGDEKNGRLLAGAKGIGRFSCDRLGRFLDMYTRKKDNPIYHLSIDWQKFEVDDEKDLKIQDIEIVRREINEQEFKEKFNVSSFEQGTFIEISKLRSLWVTPGKKGKWNTSEILDLRRYLEKLINPYQAFQGEGFVIELVADELKADDELKKPAQKINGIIDNKIFQKLNFTTTVIETEVSQAGDNITTTLTDKNRNVFKVVEKNVDYRLLKDIKIIIFYLNPYAKAYFKRNTGIRSVNFGSIFLFINGFRVNPLGDSGDDWLRMEVRKGQGHAKFLGTREVVGRIEINDHNRDFKIISSREGIVKDRRYSQIVDIQPSSYRGLFYKTLKRLEKYVVEGLDWDKTEIGGKTIEKMVDLPNWKYEPGSEKYRLNQSKKDENVLALLSSIVLVETKQEDIISLHIDKELITQLLLEQKDKAREKFNKLFAKNTLFTRDVLDDLTWNTINNIREELEEKKKEIKKKDRILAKKERQIETLTQRKRELEEDLEKEKKRVDELEEKSSEQEKEIYFVRKHLDHSVDYTQLLNMHHQIGITSGLINDRLADLKDDVIDSEINKESLIEYIKSLSFENHKINVISDIATQARFNAQSPKLDQASLTQFIIQYINEVSKHSIKTINQDDMEIELNDSQVEDDFICNFNSFEIAMLFDNLFSNSRKARAEKISVLIRSDCDELNMSIKDNGVGIPSKNKEKIFEFGFSTTYGTGLGLTHVKKILHNLNGEIILNEKLKRGCEFLIKVKR